MINFEYFDRLSDDEQWLIVNEWQQWFERYELSFQITRWSENDYCFEDCKKKRFLLFSNQIQHHCCLNQTSEYLKLFFDLLKLMSERKYKMKRKTSTDKLDDKNRKMFTDWNEMKKIITNKWLMKWINFIKWIRDSCEIEWRKLFQHRTIENEFQMIKMKRYDKQNQTINWRIKI